MPVRILGSIIEEAAFIEKMIGKIKEAEDDEFEDDPVQLRKLLPKNEALKKLILSNQ